MTWTFDPVTVVLILASAAGYGLGVRAAWRHGGPGAGFTPWHVAAFCGGLLALAIALVSPLAWLSEVLFSAHMTQHEILMLVAAPLLVFGRPLLAMLWAVPARRRAGVARACRRPAVVSAWRWLTTPLTVFLLHGIALWIWHVPALFESALHSGTVHAAQHLSFVVTAALFWWGMVHGRYGRAGYGVGVLYVFLTALHSTLLGALLTIAPSTWYRSYEASAVQRRIDSLADQQLAGLVMWVPSGVIFIVIGLALAAAWLGESERRVLLGSTAGRRRVLTSRPGSGPGLPRRRACRDRRQRQPARLSAPSRPHSRRPCPRA
jgi:putative membrane protein